MTRPHDFTGSVLTDRYHLEHLLGAGAFASVYFARDRKTYEREVAVKVLHPEHTRNPDYVERFRQEVKVAARVATRYREHLIQIVDQGVCAAHTPPLVYFVMEYIDGVSLRSLVSDTRSGVRVQRPLAWQRAVALAQQLCRAIAPLHAHGVIHRDIKPENCIIERRSDRECIKLLDLGIAKVVPDMLRPWDGPTTGARMVLGTPRYMAPEQMGGLDVDQRVDIYAVGVILYEFLTGTMPRRLDFADVEAGLIPPEPRPPSRVAPDMNIPAALDAAVLQAIAWRREDRFARADALAAALEDASRTAPARTRGVTSRITQPFLPRTPTRRVALGAPPTVAAEPVAAAAPPTVSPAVSAPRGAPAPRSHPLARAAMNLNGVLAGAGSLSSILFGLAMLTTVRTAETGPSPRPVLEDMSMKIQPPAPRRTARERPDPATTRPPGAAPANPTLVATTPPPGAAATRRRAPPSPTSSAPTTRSLVKRAEGKAHLRCGSTGETRIVNFVLKFGPGAAYARSARLVGPWSGNQFVEFGQCVSDVLRAIDFSAVRDRPTELRGTLRL